MSSSKSSPKRAGKSSFKPPNVSAFDLFYQMTYMSAMSSAGISRAKTFEIAAASPSTVSGYFKAINRLVKEFRYDYPDACRLVGDRAKTDEMRSFLLRLSDALRSGEPLPDFLGREAAVQGQNYANAYEREIETLKQWTDAFSSLVVSVALIVIIQLVSSMIYSMNTTVVAGLMTTAVVIGFFGAWIISRAAPQEKTMVGAAEGSMEQRRTLRMAQLFGPLAVVVGIGLALLGLDRGWVLIGIASLLFPVGMASMAADKKVDKRNEEFGTLLRSLGGMATSAGTTLKQSLTKIDLSSFPTLQPDVDRLSKRLQAQVNPDICWSKFGLETGSQLITEGVDIFYGAIHLGGDPERVGFLVSQFVTTTSQLRAKRRIVSSTFTGLTLVMQGVVAGLMIFVLEIINNFIQMMNKVITPKDAAMAAQNIAMPMSSITPEQFSFLTTMTVGTVILLAAIGAAAILAADGGFKLKFGFYLAVAFVISGVGFLIIPPAVAGILLSTTS